MLNTKSAALDSLLVAQGDCQYTEAASPWGGGSFMVGQSPTQTVTFNMAALTNSMPNVTLSATG